VATYDVTRRAIGDWHELGSAPILDAEWLDDTLVVVIQADSDTDDPFDPSRLERFPPHVQRFRLSTTNGER